MIPHVATFFWILVGGILPAVIWLLFWLREDRLHPEPRSIVILTFIAGMIAVPLAIPIQRAVNDPTNTSLTFLLWAIIEEILKFGAFFLVALRSGEVDEPTDSLIYIMTAALGFAAAENALFLLEPITHGNITESLITGNMRFVGASLLHTVSSAFIGACMALTFYKAKFTKRFAIFVGLVGAIALHALFNIFIMKGSDGTTAAAFGFVWILIIALMLVFEKVKRTYAVDTL
ncbi:MAG TPA: PrsW family glutamic-type intramembrane protease [Candidatus Paceibacterota bacterium]